MSCSVVTLTLSPALDVSTSVEVVAPTHKLRCRSPRREAGGGGINVARVAARLGAETVAVAPLGGCTGDEIVDLLAAEEVELLRVFVASDTRESFSVFEETTGDQFRFIAPGEELAPAEVQRCIDMVVSVGRSANVVVVSGSLPPGSPENLFAVLVDRLAPTPVIFDSSGSGLSQALSSRGLAVKPSVRELSTFAGQDLLTEQDIVECAEHVLAEVRISALIVSLGAGGAFLVERDRAPVRFRAPSVRVVSAIGAGDSMVAGVAVAIARGASLIEATRLGIATGTAAVLTAGTELCLASDVDGLRPIVTIDPDV